MSSASSSVGRNSLIMASGTLASRLTGQIRTILLAGALGVTGIAADAYQVGSQIPQVVFNLLAGGLLNAILVPQIVKAFKQRDFSSRINKLLTLSVVILLAFTFLLMIATPVLVNIYIDSGWTPAQKALANAFTLWCMPQIFFYGLYTVLGQVLAAKDKFGAYAWSSVGANIVSCLGFGAFILFFGNAKNQPLDFWTNDKIALSAGTWTLGVAVQALILVIPLMKLGLKLKPEWGFRGIGLRSMGKVAIWSLGMVVLDQLAGIVNTRITTGAPVVTGDRIGTAGSQAYMQAFQIWILPYSLITVSLATAIFPRLSRAIADRRIDSARSELSGSLRTSGAVMIFFTAAFIAIPIPIIRSLLPSVSVHDASFMAIALVGLSFGLLPSSVTLLLRRAFFAYEDGRSPFILSLIQNGAQVILLLISVQFVDAHYWVGAVGGSLALSNIILLPISYMFIRKRMDGRIEGHRIVALYAKTIMAGVVVTFVGLVLSPLCQRLVGANLNGSEAHMSWVQAVVISAIVGLVMAALYVGLLYLLKVTELTAFLSGLMRRLRGRRKVAEPVTAQASSQSLAESEIPPSASDSRATPADTMASGSNLGSVRHMIPAIGDTINNRYTLIALYRSEPGLSAWLANDHTLVRDCQLFIISDSSKLAQVNAIASSLALSKDPYFTHVLHLQKQAGISVIVTELDAGISLHELLADTSHAPLSVEAMRTIAGEVAQAEDNLRKVSLNHQALSTRTVRITSTSVTVADAPVSPLLTTVIKPNSFSDSDEMLAVRQIAAILFEMITGVAFDPNSDPEQMRAIFKAFNDDVPREFVSIVTRALGIANDNGSVPVPIFTLVELLALLGAWTAPADLQKSDLDIPSKQSSASIESVTFAPVETRNLVKVPDSIVSVDAIEEVNSAGEQQSPWRANQLLFDGDDAVEEINSDSPNFLSAFESSFHSSIHQMDDLGSAFTDDAMGVIQPTQALRTTSPRKTLTEDEGQAPQQESDVSQTDHSVENSDGTDTPHPGSSSPVAPLIPEGVSAPKDAADTAIPLPSASEMTAEEQTPHAVRSARSARSSQPASIAPESEAFENPDFVDENLGEVTTIIQPIRDFPTDDDDTENGSAQENTYASEKARQAQERQREEKGPKNAVLGRNIALILAAVIMVFALIWAIFHLGITPLNSTSSQETPTWSINANNAPNPTGGSSSSSDSDQADKSDQGDKSDSSADSQATDDSKDAAADEKKEATPAVETKDKDAQKVPDPAVQPVTNTTAYPIASTNVVRKVAGIDGIGVHVHLTQAQAVQRLQITTRTGGGSAAIYANSTTTDPNNGEPLATFTFNADKQVTQVDLPQPVNTQDLVIWVTDSPSGGFYYSAIKVY